MIALIAELSYYSTRVRRNESLIAAIKPDSYNKKQCVSLNANK